MEPIIQKITHESQSSSSSQMVSSVDDLLIEIFLRVPMRSLIRFKSVSKHWQSLISDPGFGILRNPNPNPATNLIFQIPARNQPRPDDHRMESKPPPPYAYIFSFDTSRSIRTLNLPDEKSWPYDITTITSSCNGLILMRRGYGKRVGCCDYYVCNPTTNACFKLPQIPDVVPNYPEMCLAFDPSNSPHYKVVCANYTKKTFLYQFTVYSSEMGSWRNSRVEPFEASVDFDRGVYWNGALHWVSYLNSWKSIFFDPVRMSQEMIPTPHVLNKRSNLYYFGESRGHLHYAVERWSSWVGIQLDVHEMRRDYSEWFVKHTIRDPCFNSVGDCFTSFCAVVQGKTTHDDSYCVLLVKGTLVRYNFLSKTQETIFQLKGTPLEQCEPHVYSPLQHADSLCSV